ncbi:MAG TPA: phosphate ABC transporter substrate-binding protein, partial [Candidatus Acidoferrales bacterium]|nr:phosphate ABC transporter substrate-binding protein [Candidatus Acidoferrales bacterium]
MKNKKALVIGTLLGLLVGAAVLTAQQRNLTVKGSDTMVILGQRWAEVYMQKNRGVTIQVTGGGSGTGIAALINGTTDIAEASRPMKDKEKDAVKAKRSAEVLELPVAVDGLAVFLNVKNPVGELSLAQLKGIYTGAIKNWKEVGGRDERMILYGRENNSGTYVYFKEHVLENVDYFPTVQTLPGTAAVIHAVAKDPRGIGYGGVAYGEGVKHLRVRKDANSPAVEPTMENVLSAQYPISRYLYWYVAGRPKGDLKAFAEWALSKDGQAVVENVGYYPLNEKER